EIRADVGNDHRLEHQVLARNVGAIDLRLDGDRTRMLETLLEELQRIADLRIGVRELVEGAAVIGLPDRRREEARADALHDLALAPGAGRQADIELDDAPALPAAHKLLPGPAGKAERARDVVR